jgi:hypothetical protein
MYLIRQLLLPPLLLLLISKIFTSFLLLQVKELGDALAAISGSTANTAAARQMAVEVVEVLAARQADRAGV